jgi:hypothetical protein
MMKLLNPGGSQSSNTGLSEEKIGEMITKANADAEAAVTALGTAMQGILDKLGEDWGTQDSIQDVENDIMPGLTLAQKQVAAELKAVVDTVRETALKQASDTNNDFSGLPAATLPDIVTLSNKQASVLDIGLVGVKADLEKDVAEAGSNSKEAIDDALATLKSNLYSTAAEGFVDAGHTVQNKIEEHLSNVITALDTALETLMESVNGYTTGVVKYEQDIQGEWVQVEAEAQGN